MWGDGKDSSKYKLWDAERMKLEEARRKGGGRSKVYEIPRAAVTQFTKLCSLKPQKVIVP